MMAGVVRRDGLREAVARVLIDWFGEALAFDSATDYESVDAGKAAARVWVEEELLDAVLDAVPDVPPDPPTADRDELARVLDEHRLIINYGQSICRCGQRLVRSPNDSASHVWQAHHAHLAVVIAGVLVDAAVVRARAQEAAWDEGWSAARQVVREQKPGDNPYRNRAVSEREGASDA